MTKRIIILMMAMMMSAHVYAQDVQQADLSDFGTWPVLHEGRVKTMESFARANFYAVAKATSADDLSALEWLTEAIFDPSASLSRRVIYIERTGVLDLPDRASKRYTLNEVMEAMRPHQDLVMALQTRAPATLNAMQKNLMDIYRALVVYNQMIQSFSAVLPINGGDQNYIDGAGVAAQRDLIAAGGMDNTTLKIIPTDDPNMPYISLWQAILLNADVPHMDDYVTMAKAWTQDDMATWEFHAKAVKDDMKASYDRPLSLWLEHIYVTMNPIILAMILYMIGGVMLCRSGFVSYGAFVISLGGAIQFTGLLLRSYIMGRPPTGTLYETFLFSSLIVILFGCAVYYHSRNRLFLGGAVVSALIILFVSRFFVQGDSLNVLVAVLNTNFWLATHVTCIIIGYATCVIASMCAHLYLLTDRRDIKKLMVPCALIALLFTSIGTLLGGIWADQSWGRFWGWDPKENGALLIVLWLAWVLHARISGHVNFRGFAVILALTNIMVALTWFGVNLLGVGLHSYGFIEGIALGLSGFCILQIVIVGGLFMRHKQIGSEA